jgi:hypothetical protein
LEPDNYEDSKEWPADIDEVWVDYSDLSPLLHDLSLFLSYEELNLKSAEIPVLQKILRPQVTKSNEKWIQVLQNMLYDAKYRHSDLSRKLHEVETMIPDSIKPSYDSIWKDPKWYMRKELVTECAGQDGCCSRDCGC